MSDQVFCMANLTAADLGVRFAKAFLEIQSSAAWFIFQQAVKDVPDNEDMDYQQTEEWLRGLIAKEEATKTPPQKPDADLASARPAPDAGLLREAVVQAAIQWYCANDDFIDVRTEWLEKAVQALPEFTGNATLASAPSEGVRE